MSLNDRARRATLGSYAVTMPSYLARLSSIGGGHYIQGSLQHKDSHPKGDGVDFINLPLKWQFDIDTFR